ncbi:MAG: CHAP domain-containing protein [Psychrobacter sp.]|nr:CHAP domain-containing protein [Psychrobacter sp.]
MKQALLILAALGLGFSQTSVAETSYQTNYTLSQSSANYGSSNNTYTNSSSSRISSDDEISQAIASLSAQARQKEDKLASLAERLSTQPQRSANVSVLSSNSAPAIAAARASRAAHSNSTGRCARYVRQALQAAGYEFTPNGSAYEYATRGTLSNAGFVKISNNTSPQVGDVVVYSRSSKHRHGHIQIFDGSTWVSDFRQDSINPYSDTYSYTTWRDARYLDDASNRGIYLAMADE